MYEAAAKAWNSWARDYRGMAGSLEDEDLGSPHRAGSQGSAASYERYLAGLDSRLRDYAGSKARGPAPKASASRAGSSAGSYDRWEQMVRAERERLQSSSKGDSFADRTAKYDQSLADGLEELYGSDPTGYADKYGSMGAGDQATYEEKLAFLMYLQSRYESGLSSLRDRGDTHIPSDRYDSRTAGSYVPRYMDRREP